jgi:hypothetical protein
MMTGFVSHILVNNSCSPLPAGKQPVLNVNFVNTNIFRGVLPAMLQTNQAVMTPTIVPIPRVRESIKSGLAGGQHRHNIGEYLDEPMTVLAYPVFDSFEEDHQLAGVVTTSFYWKLFFTEILPPTA